MLSVTNFRNLGLFDARVPRYTSYPTAPQFTADVGPSEVANWIDAIPAHSSVSLYAHIPFCRRLCWFCACRTQGTKTAEPVGAYIETLKRELSQIGARLADGVTLEHLHWGGGTPTLLQPEMIHDLARAVFDVAPLAPGAQFSVEIDPTEVDGPRLDALAEVRLNRASIGVQDFDPMIQETIGRPQSYEITREAVDGLRARGIGSLNIDLLYGLPHQTEARIAASVDKVISLEPDRIALFGYAHVPWMSKRQQLIPSEALPSAEARLTLFNLARDMFVAAGFEEIGIDHFAKPDDGLAVAQRKGAMRRNFQGYTEDTSTCLIPVGASAIGRFPQGFAQNEPATAKYQDRVRNDQLATARGHVFAGDDLVRARIIECLLCDFEVDFAAVAAEFEADPATLIAMTEGLDAALPDCTQRDGDRLIIQDEARPLARLIARHFDAYDMSAARHSQAV